MWMPPFLCTKPLLRHSMYQSKIIVGSVASAVTLSATLLEALRVMLASLEQPDGSLAASLSGDIRVISFIVAASALSIPTSCVLSYIYSHIAGAGSPRGLSSSNAAIWLASAAVGAQAGWAGVEVVSLFVQSSQKWYLTVVLVGGGAALVLGMLRHQSQMLKESLWQNEPGDLEAGGAHDIAVVRTLPS
jgi:hypothetical protein